MNEGHVTSVLVYERPACFDVVLYKSVQLAPSSPCSMSSCTYMRRSLCKQVTHAVFQPRRSQFIYIDNVPMHAQATSWIVTVRSCGPACRLSCVHHLSDHGRVCCHHVPDQLLALHEPSCLQGMHACLV